MTCAADIKPRGRRSGSRAMGVPLGMLTLFAGKPKIGKS